MPLCVENGVLLLCLLLVLVLLLTPPHVSAAAAVPFCFLLCAAVRLLHRYEAGARQLENTRPLLSLLSDKGPR